MSGEAHLRRAEMPESVNAGSNPAGGNFKFKKKGEKKMTITINCDIGNKKEATLLKAWKAEEKWEDCECECGAIPVWVRKCAPSTVESVEAEILRQLDKL